jgi:hypothetical protein
MKSARCKHCDEIYEEKFLSDFKDGICLPCQAQRDFEEQERKDAEEVALFNKKHATSYDIYNFWEACEIGRITAEMCADFPRLMQIREFVDLMQTCEEDNQPIECDQHRNCYECPLYKASKTKILVQTHKK